MSHVYVSSDDEILALSTLKGSTSFHYSFSFLPREERRAIRTMYAFARRIDDIVDNSPSRNPVEIARKRVRLDWWRNEIELLYLSNNANADMEGDGRNRLSSVIHQFSIPKQYLLTLIDGCERDLTYTRYETFSELKEYCYSVASIIGLICIEIFGYRYDETRQYAINLGYALQLTNILRDIRQDKERGTIYLPLEDLDKFQYSERDIINEVYDDRFVELMSFQVHRARDFYHKARTLLRPDERMTMVAAEIMDAIYYRLLEKIELTDYRVYQKRIRVSAAHKFITALRIWLGSKLFVQRLRG
ncbi:MAG: squalene/phytoene synthase family protein [Ignavibacteria bacterium]|nr:squalene/phytoene synthase family protein [Ignavibacteria bacterium]